MKKHLLKTFLLVVCLLGGGNFSWAYELPDGYEIKTVYIGTNNGDGTVASDAFDYESVPGTWVAQDANAAVAIGDKTNVANVAVGSTPANQPTYVNGKTLQVTVSGTNWTQHWVRYTLADAVSTGKLIFRADMYQANSPTFIRFLDANGNELLKLGFNNGSGDKYYQYNVNGGSSSNCDMHTTYRTYHGFSIEDLVLDMTTGSVSFYLDYINTNSSNQRAQVTNTKNITFGAGKAVKYFEIGSTVNSSQTVHYDNIQFYHIAEAGKNNYEIYARAGETNLQLLASGQKAKDEEYSATGLPLIIKYNNQYYTLDDANVTNYATPTYTMGDADETKYITYTLDETIVYFEEGESLCTSSYAGNYSGGYAAAYRSAGDMSHLNRFNSTVISETGAYKADIYVTGGISNGRAYGVYKVENEALTMVGQVSFSSNKTASAGLYSTSNFLVDGGTKLYTGGANNTLDIDYLIIRKSPVAYRVEYKCGETEIKAAVTDRTAVWGTYASLTDADKQDVTYNGHLYRYVSDDASSQEIVSDGTTVITATFRDLGSVATITYALNVGTSASTTIKASATSTDGTNITGVDIDQTHATGNDAGAGTDRTTKLPIKTGDNGETYDSPTNYVEFKYTVAAGKQFTPNSIAVKVANVGSTSANKVKYKAELSDGTHSISNTYVVTTQDGTVETFYVTNNSEIAFSGDVTLKLWAWTIDDTSNASAFRMGTPLTITGTIETLQEVVDAIADCKANETSEAFATAIATQSFTTPAEVYAFHTQWQIEQADDEGSNDITKVIFDAAVSSNARWNSARTLTGQQYTGATDNTYFDAYHTSASDASQKIYGLPAGTYTIKVATRSSASLTDKSKYNVWVSGGTANASLLGSHIGNAGGTLGNGWNWTYLSFTLDAEADVTIGFYAKPENSLWASCDDWHLYKGTLESSVSATVGTSGFATFVSPYSLDFTSTSIKPYTVTVDEKGVATLTQKTQVPSNTPILLYKKGGATEDIPVIGSAEAIGDNNLIAGTGNTVATDDGDYTNMILWMDGTHPIGFYFANGQTVATNRAYLHIADDVAPTTSTSRMVMVFANDETTGIKNLNAELNLDNKVYDLQGRSVAQPTKGLYIVNGKKVVVK